MINSHMKEYNYSVLGAKDAYGQPTEAAATNVVKMAIFINNQTLNDNVTYTDAEFIGLTYDTSINDTCIINYNGSKLKVKNTNPSGRLMQVFMNGC